MAWLHVDDRAAFHPKVVKAGNTATGAWFRMACWCSAHLTDGKLPRQAALSVASKDIVARLVRVGLLDADGKDFAVHDYLDWNPSAKVIRAKSQERSLARSASGKAGASKRWHQAGEQEPEKNVKKHSSTTLGARGVFPGTSDEPPAENHSLPDGKPDGKGDGKPIANGMANGWPSASASYIHTNKGPADGKTLTPDTPPPEPSGNGKLTVGEFHERLMNAGLGVVPPKWSPVVEKLAPFTEMEVAAALTQAKASGGRVVPGFVIRIIERWRTEPPEQPKSGPMPGSEWAASRQRETQLRKAEREHRKPECDEAERGQRQEQGAKAIGDILAGLFDPTEAKP